MEINSMMEKPTRQFLTRIKTAEAIDADGILRHLEQMPAGQRLLAVAALKSWGEFEALKVMEYAERKKRRMAALEELGLGLQRIAIALAPPAPGPPGQG